MKNKSISILGSNGFVGNILKKYYPEAIGYDIKGESDKLEEVLNRDIIFVAINLIDNCTSKESIKILDGYFSLMKPNTIVIIKSTFVPHTTDYFQIKYPQLKFVYNPEFLTEATAWEDFSEPQFQILGCPYQSLDLANELFELLPNAPIKKIISPRDAEVLKHAFNSYYATKVIWFNGLYDVCQELGADYETIREIMTKNEWVGDSHTQIFHKGYRSFGTPKVSKCLPKDVAAFCKVANFPLLDKVKELNEEYCRQQNMC